MANDENNNTGANANANANEDDISDEEIRRKLYFWHDYWGNKVELCEKKLLEGRALKDQRDIAKANLDSLAIETTIEKEIEDATKDYEEKQRLVDAHNAEYKAWWESIEPYFLQVGRALEMQELAANKVKKMKIKAQQDQMEELQRTIDGLKTGIEEDQKEQKTLDEANRGKETLISDLNDTIKTAEAKVEELLKEHETIKQTLYEDEDEDESESSGEAIETLAEQYEED